MSLSLWLFGGQRVGADADCSTALLDICLRHAVSYTDFRLDERGTVSFVVPSFRLSTIKRACESEGVRLRVFEKLGLPYFFARHRRRVGFLVGGFLAILLIVLSQKFVWDVRIYGNEQMTEDEVVAELMSCGFGVGSYIPDLSAPQLENRVLLASNRISWISIRMDGTVAVVQVIEQIPPTDREESHKPANLVAAADGQIEYLQLYRGNPVVVVGQAVRKGELLVSGIYDSNLYGYRYTRAAGQVMARTNREIVVEIPLTYEEKCVGETFVGEKYLHFFNFSVKISKNSRNVVGSCDIIKEKNRVEVPGLSRLPLFVETVTVTPYAMQTTTRTHEAALELAYAELETRLSALAEDAQILQKEITTELLDDSLRLVCKITCMEDIAVQSEFEITDVS